MSNRRKDYAYDFSRTLVAEYPAVRRDDSRLMVLDRDSRTWAHRRFRDIKEYLGSGDALVVNDSRVFPGRLMTRRPAGGRQEILLVRRERRDRDGDVWQALVNAGRKLRPGETFEFPGLRVTILEGADETRLVRLDYDGNLEEILGRVGSPPLPPYIRRPIDLIDRDRYQTVYAAHTGSVAAPTAGLHFTPELLSGIRARGTRIAEVTLHVGPGTFLPVRTDDLSRHRMHGECFAIAASACATVNDAKTKGGRVTAVGTTATRVLEALGAGGEPLSPTEGETDLFIRPPYAFRVVDRLLTNFHQPESTLLMLVCAFAGREFVLEAYAEAVRERYRLFSYGDAMLIL